MSDFIASVKNLHLSTKHSPLFLLFFHFDIKKKKIWQTTKVQVLLCYCFKNVNDVLRWYLREKDWEPLSWRMKIFAITLRFQRGRPCLYPSPPGICRGLSLPFDAASCQFWASSDASLIPTTDSNLNCAAVSAYVFTAWRKESICEFLTPLVGASP